METGLAPSRRPAVQDGPDSIQSRVDQRYRTWRSHSNCAGSRREHAVVEVITAVVEHSREAGLSKCHETDEAFVHARLQEQADLRRMALAKESTPSPPEQPSSRTPTRTPRAPTDTDLAPPSTAAPDHGAPHHPRNNQNSVIPAHRLCRPSTLFRQAMAMLSPREFPVAVKRDCWYRWKLVYAVGCLPHRAPDPRRLGLVGTCRLKNESTVSLCDR